MLKKFGKREIPTLFRHSAGDTLLQTTGGARPCSLLYSRVNRTVVVLVAFVWGLSQETPAEESLSNGGFSNVMFKCRLPGHSLVLSPHAHISDTAKYGSLGEDRTFWPWFATMLSIK